MKDSITKKQEELIIYYYQEELLGQSAASKKVFGKNYPTLVKDILQKNGIRIRTQREAAIISNKKRVKKKNENYFSIQSHNMAWLLGFLASVGTIRKDSNQIKIGLSSVDKEILEKIRDELEIETKVKEYINNQGYSCASLTWTSEQHKKDLAKYGIIPQKTFNLVPPYGLERQYWIDYIRGYFDGDGSVNLIHNSNGRGNRNLRWQICSSTKEILEFIIDFLYQEYNIPKVNILEEQRVHTLYYFQYSSVATRKIHSILYTPDSLYLKRKKDHFDEIVQKVKPLYK